MTTLNLHFENESQFDAIPARELFQHWVESSLKKFCAQAEISLTIVDENKMTEINKESRGIDRPTNTLAFTYPHDNKNLPLFGEIVMCAPVISKETAELNIENWEHWAHLTVHSCLHLAGLTHDKDEDAIQMEALESVIMQEMGFQDPHIRD